MWIIEVEPNGKNWKYRLKRLIKDINFTEVYEIIHVESGFSSRDIAVKAAEAERDRRCKTCNFL